MEQHPLTYLSLTLFHVEQDPLISLSTTLFHVEYSPSDLPVAHPVPRGTAPLKAAPILRKKYLERALPSVWRPPRRTDRRLIAVLRHMQGATLSRKRSIDR